MGVSLECFHSSPSYRHPLRRDATVEAQPQVAPATAAGFLCACVSGAAALLTKLSHLKFGFLDQGGQRRGVPFPARSPRAAAGGGQRARAANKGGAGRGARGRGRRASLRQEAAAPRPGSHSSEARSPRGDVTPRLRPRPSPSKVTLD